VALRALYDVLAPAKLNLFLHVVGRRDDGYHLLQSIFVPIDWFDTLHFERREDCGLVRRDLGAALPADDLCLRAARALQHASGTSAGADIAIDKRIPSGAGMGGGSSDAASTLLALNRLWGLHWPHERLSALALGLGADVPFFLGGGPALVEGVGERLTPVDLPPERFAVIWPGASVETRAIFHSPLLRHSDPRDPAGILVGFAGGASARWRNDLQDAAQAASEEVGRAVAWLQRRYGNSRMTGSGSAVFAWVDGDPAVSSSMPAGLPAEWTGRICSSLPAHPLAGWAD
jgi:4-diphosphocytidyl-2-C-methyl-D-erythritol kinase